MDTQSYTQASQKSGIKPIVVLYQKKFLLINWSTKSYMKLTDGLPCTYHWPQARWVRQPLKFRETRFYQYFGMEQPNIIVHLVCSYLEPNCLRVFLSVPFCQCHLQQWYVFTPFPKTYCIHCFQWFLIVSKHGFIIYFYLLPGGEVFGGAE